MSFFQWSDHSLLMVFRHFKHTVITQATHTFLIVSAPPM